MNSISQTRVSLIVLVVLLSATTTVLTLWIGSQLSPETMEHDIAAQHNATPPIVDAASRAEAVDDVTIAALQDRITELENSLVQEQDGRLMLQRTLAEQKTQLDALKRETTLLSERSIPAEADAMPAAPDDIVHAGLGGQDGIPEGRARWQERGIRQTPSVTALLDAGVDETVAMDLIARQDARALAELELRDQAAREGWLDAEDFNERLQASLPERLNLRDELDAAQWDQYLYASGRTNRVSLAGVLNGSAAHNALLQTGDRLLSYAGEPVYTVRDLQRGTRGGSRGEMVAIRVQRGDEILELSVPRGPLGVNLSPERVDPDGSNAIP